MHTSIIRMETRSIQHKLEEMVKIVINQHIKMNKALIKNDKEETFIILNDDRLVNAKFDEITTDLEFLITKTPLDKDLRRTMAYIMIAQDLERIGDYVKYIGKFVIKSNELDQSSINRITQIHRPFIQMLRKLTEIIHGEIYESAIKLAKNDKKIDVLTEKLRTDLITSLTNRHSKTEVESRVFAMNVIAGIERAADHVTHICELIGYIYTGKHVDLE